MSLVHLSFALVIVPTHIVRAIHVALVLFLVFLLFPVSRRYRNRVLWWDWAMSALSLTVLGHMLADGDAFLERSTGPTLPDRICGVALILLVLEAVRRCSGWIMPFVVLLFLFYAFVGAHLPPPWTHHGMDVGRVVGHMYMTMEGIFGVPVDVSSSLIIMFTIYGASCNTPAPASSSSTSRSRQPAARPPAPDAPSCSHRSCWADPPAAVLQRR